MKTASNKTLKKKAWDIFSQYVRARDCLLTTGTFDRGRCVTCGKVFPIQELQAGHAIGGRYNSILFDEELVNAQCLTGESRLKMVDGSYKSIGKIGIGDRLLAFNEKTFKEEEAIVLGLNSFIPPKLYEVVMENGDIFYATGDHMVVANGSFVRIEDMLHNVSAYNIMEYNEDV